MKGAFPYLSVCFCILNSLLASAQNEQFSQRVVNSSYTLNSAWEITYGPNDSLWVTENKGYLVSRISIATGAKTVLLNLLGTGGDASINFSENGSGGKNKKLKPAVWPQGGLMGLALHPSLLSSDPAVRNSKPWVYIAYVYNYANPSGCSSSTPCYFYSKIVRYTYSGSSLTTPVVILDSIPGSNDHNSGRLKIGADQKLYYTIGDMGAGQFNNTSRTNHASNMDVLEGKVIRLNTEPDGNAGKDAWIPNDNPFYEPSVINARDYIFSLGHRNAQGLDWANIGGSHILYSSEHGDKSDDEVNIISSGKHYGWNRMVGYCDGNYDGKTLGGFSPVNEGAFCSNTPNNAEPIFTMFTATPAEINSFTGDIFTFKTIAPSSIEIYSNTSIPGWQNSILVPGLKAGRVYRMKLNASGTGIQPLASGVDTAVYFAGQGRFRDIAISPNGLKIYLACDLSGATSGPTGGFNSKNNQSTPPNAGKILEFTYTGGGTSSASRTLAALTELSKSVSIYPNPAQDVITVNIGNNFVRPVSTELFNMVGARVRSIRSFTGRNDISLRGLPAGIYSLRITDDRGKVWIVEKIVKR